MWKGINGHAYFLCNIEKTNKLCCQATILCGFTANVLNIKEKKTYHKLKQIKDISKIHHVKYLYDDNKLQYQEWQYSGIGIGRNLKFLESQLHPSMTRKSRL